MTAIVIGALLLVAGIVYMAGATLKRGRAQRSGARGRGAGPHDPGNVGPDARAGTARPQVSRPDDELAGIVDGGGRRRAAVVGDGLDWR